MQDRNQIEDYREVLKREFAVRRQRNPSYSLRAYARDLKVFPSRLSAILNGKQGFSGSSAAGIAGRLGLSPDESRWFRASVESLHGRSTVSRGAAKAVLSAMKSQDDYQPVKEAYFAIVSDWYHFAILELTLLKGFKSDPEWIAKKLGISKIEVELAIGRLLRVGLMEREKNRLRAVTTFPSVTPDVPSDSVKKFHSQVLEKAGRALYFQSMEERDFSSIVMAINPADLPEAKAEIKHFRRQFEAKYKSRADLKAVYCLAIQLFSLSHKQENP